LTASQKQAPPPSQVPGSSAGLSRQREAPGTILPSNAEQRGRSSEIDGSNNRRGVSVVGREAKTLQLKIVPRLLITSTTLSPPAAGVLLPTYFQPAVRGGLLASGDLTSEKRKIDHEEGNREQRGWTIRTDGADLRIGATPEPLAVSSFNCCWCASRSRAGSPEHQRTLRTRSSSRRPTARPTIETFPMDLVANTHWHMISGKVRFRSVLKMDGVRTYTGFLP
jgi:hypothetical protein